MEALQRALSRRIGPFPVFVWLLILAAGVTAGLIIRRFAIKRGGGSKEDFSGTAQPSNVPDVPLSPLPIRVGATGARVVEDFDPFDAPPVLVPRDSDEGVPILRPPLAPVPRPGVSVPDTPTRPARPEEGGFAPIVSPTATGQTYTVRKGDTLFGIAERFYGPGNGNKWPLILSANPNALSVPGDVRTLRIGAVLVVPALAA